MACHSTPSKKRRATLDHARDVIDTATQIPLLPSRNKDVNHVPSLHHKLACIAFVSCDISLPCFFWNKLMRCCMSHLTEERKECVSRTFFAGSGGSPQCGSALRRGLHVPRLKNHSGWVWAGKTKRRGCALEAYASSAHGTRDMHDAYSTSLPQATAHVTSHLTVMYLYARRGERGVCGALFFTDCGGNPQNESALRQGLHVHPAFNTAARACSPSFVPRIRAARSRERPFVMDRRSANRRTWRNKPSQLTDGPHGDPK